MDAVTAFCERLLGHGDAADAAAQAARRRGGGDELAALAAAAAACQRAPAQREDGEGDGGEVPLAQAVANEVSAAAAGLPAGQRAGLALRDLLGLAHEQVARVLGIDDATATLLIARARLALRAQLRGPSELPACDERERALRTLARRQDGEPVSDADDDWVVEHLGHCVGCARSHAAMLEASACYRAWRHEPAPAP